MPLIKQKTVDWNKLAREFEKRNLTATEVAEKLGYAREYFNNNQRRGDKLAYRAIMMLEQMYDIRYEEYEPSPDPEPVIVLPAAPVAPQPQPFELDYTKLYNVIYEAVYLAVKKAWSE